MDGEEWFLDKWWGALCEEKKHTILSHQYIYFVSCLLHTYDKQYNVTRFSRYGILENFHYPLLQLLFVLFSYLFDFVFICVALHESQFNKKKTKKKQKTGEIKEMKVKERRENEKTRNGITNKFLPRFPRRAEQTNHRFIGEGAGERGRAARELKNARSVISRHDETKQTKRNAKRSKRVRTESHPLRFVAIPRRVLGALQLRSFFVDSGPTTATATIRTTENGTTILSVIHDMSHDTKIHITDNKFATRSSLLWQSSHYQGRNPVHAQTRARVQRESLFRSNPLRERYGRRRIA